MTATNIFYNFVGFKYSPPYTTYVVAIRTTMNDSHLVQLFDVCSSRSYSAVTMSKGGRN